MHGSLSTSPNRSTGTLGATGDSTLGVLSAKATTVESLTDTGDASVGGKLTVTGKGGHACGQEPAAEKRQTEARRRVHMADMRKSSASLFT